MIGDDTGDNLSKLNRSLSEMSAIYWAWKNYKELGNPKYIGFAHYRRLIRPDGELNNFDIYVSKKYILKKSESVFNQYINSHKKEDIEIAIKILKEKFPDYALSADEYLQDNKAYFNNLFIMRKEIFFEYCEWLFSILFEVQNQIDLNDFKTQDGKCVLAFLSERLSGIFMHHKAKLGYKIKEVDVIEYK